MRNFTWATSSGRTQCTGLSTRGEPKRLLRGGRTSSGILSERLQAMPQPFDLGRVDAMRQSAPRAVKSHIACSAFAFVPHCIEQVRYRARAVNHMFDPEH